jgi:hypothetical protein
MDNLRQMKFREEQLPTNMTKSLIYLIFFHHIIIGKPVDPTTREDEEIISKYYINEKKFKIYSDPQTNLWQGFNKENY